MNKKEAITAAAKLSESVDAIIDSDEVSLSEVNGCLTSLDSIARVLSELSAHPRKFPIFTVTEAVNPECANTNGG